jgi:tRNA(Ile)-lysidine synthase
VNEYIQLIGLDYDSKKINEVFDFIEANIDKRNGSTLSLATAMWLYTDNKIVETIPHKKQVLADRLKPIKVEKEGTYKFGETKFTIKKYAENELFVFPDSTANFAYVDLSNEKLPLTIRARKEGDIITPFGMKGSMKLKKYLNGKGVSKHRRDDIPLLCSDTEVLWVAGVGISDKIGVKDKPTHVIEVEKG